jgi:hypothetical protein
MTVEIAVALFVSGVAMILLAVLYDWVYWRSPATSDDD